MADKISPRYQMKLVKQIEDALWDEFETAKYRNVEFYIEKWHESGYDDWGSYYENFAIKKNNGNIDLSTTLHAIDEELLIKIAIDLGIETPDFIPSIPTFKNKIKSEYPTASATFEKAFKQIEEHPDLAIGLANSALESILKEILKDERIKTKYKGTDTLYKLVTALLKELKLYPDSELPEEMKTLGSSLLSASQTIEKLRSEKTAVHGKTADDYVVNDSLYTYFVVNSVTTIGLFLDSYYKQKFPPIVEEEENSSVVEEESDDLPF